MTLIAKSKMKKLNKNGKSRTTWSTTLHLNRFVSQPCSLQLLQGHTKRQELALVESLYDHISIIHRQVNSIRELYFSVDFSWTNNREIIRLRTKLFRAIRLSSLSSKITEVSANWYRWADKRLQTILKIQVTRQASLTNRFQSLSQLALSFHFRRRNLTREKVGLILLQVREKQAIRLSQSNNFQESLINQKLHSSLLTVKLSLIHQRRHRTQFRSHNALVVQDANRNCKKRNWSNPKLKRTRLMMQTNWNMVHKLKMWSYNHKHCDKKAVLILKLNLKV